MTIIDGKKIAQEIKDELAGEIASLGIKPKLGIFTIAPDPTITQFVGLKKRFGEAVGIEVETVQKGKDILQEEAEDVLRAMIESFDGVVVQLPIPEHLDAKKLLNMVPSHKDPDVLADASTDALEEGVVLPPVAGAVREVLQRYDIDPAGRKIAIVGAGQLVGMPVYYWLVSRGILPELFDMQNAQQFTERSKEFDILISGVGKAGLITPDMVREGAVLIDAGSSESSGKIVGDIDPACAEKASYFSPVPGGIGPVTVAILFRNLVLLSK